MRVVAKGNPNKVYDIPNHSGGNKKVLCPVCMGGSKKEKSLSFNYDKRVGNCKRGTCQAIFYEYDPNFKPKVYVIPEWKNKTELTDKALSWFNGRMISQSVLSASNVSSSVEWMPQINKEISVICFPYYRGEIVANIKYRDGLKNFKLVKGAELILYNLNSLVGQKECIITEGEIDCLSFIEAGINNVVSVPNGAGGKNMEYIDNSYMELSEIETFYIAVDNDSAGFSLREELIRRLGAEKCKIISYQDCKDANEYLVKHGAIELSNLIKTAKDVPQEDIIELSSIYDKIYDLYQNGLQRGAIIKDEQIDKLISWESGRLYTVTGIPSHGKSEWVDHVVTRLNSIYGWKVVYYSPENYPIPIHFSKIASKVTGKKFDATNLEHAEFKRAYEYISENFFFVYPEEDVTVDNILAKAKYLIRRRGVKILVIDPYNKLEHSKDVRQSETEYISSFLDKVTMFAKQNDCIVILVAHPRKMEKEKDSEKYKMPTLYDISGSANFFNKTDFGVTVYRDFSEKTITVQVQKAKFRHLGEVGSVEYKYNIMNGRFEYAYRRDNETYIDKDWDRVQLPIQGYDPNEYIEHGSDIPF